MSPEERRDRDYNAGWYDGYRSGYFRAKDNLFKIIIRLMYFFFIGGVVWGLFRWRTEDSHWYVGLPLGLIGGAMVGGSAFIVAFLSAVGILQLKMFDGIRLDERAEHRFRPPSKAEDRDWNDAAGCSWRDFAAGECTDDLGTIKYRL